LFIKSIAFFGPKGTFTHEVASTLGENLFAYCSIPSVLRAVETGECDLGVVPIENSIEGPVGITLDLLVHSKLYIIGEMVISINHNLLADKGVDISDVKFVFSHSQALAQCQNYLESHGFKAQFALSTAAAAKSILGKKDSAAIGTLKSASLYGLDIIDRNIQDLNNNQTRFILLSKDKNLNADNDKTSIVFSMFEDHPGELYEILGLFAASKINLSKIESRPSKECLGKYIFFIDFEGNQEDENIAEILDEISKSTSYMRILGSYSQISGKID
jgi:prephenate dehydratase